MDGAGSNMCKAVDIDGVAVRATFISRVCVGGEQSYATDLDQSATISKLIGIL